MQIRYLVTASLMHGALIVGVGLGFRSLSEEPRVPPKVGIAIPQVVTPVLVETEIVEPPAPTEPLREPELVDPPPPPRPDDPRPTEASAAPLPIEREPEFVDVSHCTVPPPLPVLLHRVIPKVESAPKKEQAIRPEVIEPKEAAAQVDAELIDEHNQPPRYSPLARRLRVRGTVVLLVSVDDAGVVRDVDLRTSCGRSAAHKELDRAAIEAVWKWRYRPAQRHGRAVSAVVRVPIEFRPR